MNRSASSQAAAVVWYPGSGLDAGPCLTDVRQNPLRTHLLRPNGEGTLHLWMSDYAPEVIQQFENQSPELQGFEDPALMNRLGIRSVSCTVVERRRVREWNTARRITEQRAFSRDLRLPDWDVIRAHVTVRRKDREDCYVVRFSPFDSEAMVRVVLRQNRLYALVLLRMGGFSMQRQGLDHHSPEFLDLVRRTIGLPEYVVTDSDDSVWARPPYHSTGNELVGWKRWAVRLFRLKGHKALRPGKGRRRSGPRRGKRPKATRIRSSGRSPKRTGR